MYLIIHIGFQIQTTADLNGIVALGGDLSPRRVLLAYKQGIFPWFSEDEPILWWSPDPRMVLFPKEFKLSKSLKKTLRTTPYRVTFNTAFEAVIDGCARVQREGQQGTWISQQMKQTYLELHRQNSAISVEVWEADILVGGLYGIDLPEIKLFSGESMFSIKDRRFKNCFCSFGSLVYYTKLHLDRLSGIYQSSREFRSQRDR